LVILLLEGLHMLDVCDVVLHAVEGGQRLGGDGVAEVLFDLHCDFDRIQGVQPVVGKDTILGHA